MSLVSSANSQIRLRAKPLKVAVLSGGIGREREVSIQSGRCVAEALKEAGFAVVTADIRPDNLSILDDGEIGVFFLALHGEFGEDGQLQQILEEKSCLYTGSGPVASRRAFDKMASKRAFAEAGIATPPVIEFNSGTDIREVEKQLNKLASRYVVKPVRQGSSVGVGIFSSPREAVAAARKCLDEFGDCMIEKFVSGREITVGILCGQPLPTIEIRTQMSFYDYHAKYVDEKTEFLFGTIDDAVQEANIKAAAIDCFNSLGLRHFSRVDFILGEDGVAYALEVNTIPGFTSHSLLPRAAAKAGLSMSNLCVRIIEAALEDNRAKEPS